MLLNSYRSVFLLLNHIYPFIGFFFKNLKSLQNNVLWFIHSQRLNMEFEHILLLAKVNSFGKLVVSDAFSASGAVSWILDGGGHYRYKMKSIKI